MVRLVLALVFHLRFRVRSVSRWFKGNLSLLEICYRCLFRRFKQMERVCLGSIEPKKMQLLKGIQECVRKRQRSAKKMQLPPTGVVFA